MKLSCKKCGSDAVLAQSIVCVDREVLAVEDVYCPELSDEAYVGWETEQAARPQFMCGNCGFESDDIRDFLEGG